MSSKRARKKLGTLHKHTFLRKMRCRHDLANSQVQLLQRASAEAMAAVIKDVEPQGHLLLSYGSGVIAILVGLLKYCKSKVFQSGGCWR